MFNQANGVPSPSPGPPTNRWLGEQPGREARKPVWMSAGWAPAAAALSPYTLKSTHRHTQPNTHATCTKHSPCHAVRAPNLNDDYARAPVRDPSPLAARLSTAQACDTEAEGICCGLLLDWGGQLWQGAARPLWGFNQQQPLPPHSPGSCPGTGSTHIHTSSHEVVCQGFIDDEATEEEYTNRISLNSSQFCSKSIFKDWIQNPELRMRKSGALPSLNTAEANRLNWVALC